MIFLYLIINDDTIYPWVRKMTRYLGRKKAHYTNEKHTFSDWMKDRFGFATIFFGAIGLFWFVLFLLSGHVIGLVMVIVFILASLLTLYLLNKNYHNYVELYELGFVLGIKTKTTTIFYDEIVSTKWYAQKVKVKGIPVHSYSLTIEKQNGDKYRIDNGNIGNVLELSSEIHQSFFQLKVPQLIASLQQGKSIKFGKLTITPMGIERKKKLLPWSEVDYVKIENGYVWIMKKGQNYPWGNMISSKPNALLLHEFINTYINQARSLIRF